MAGRLSKDFVGSVEETDVTLTIRSTTAGVPSPGGKRTHMAEVSTEGPTIMHDWTMVPMRDGVKLSTEVFRPSSGHNHLIHF